MEGDDAKRAKKIPDAVWNDHRQEIERVYQTKELQGEDGVIAWMYKNHGFKARYTASTCPQEPALISIPGNPNTNTNSRSGAFGNT
jgi:hypothetical protein